MFVVVDPYKFVRNRSLNDLNPILVQDPVNLNPDLVVMIIGIHIRL